MSWSVPKAPYNDAQLVERAVRAAKKPGAPRWVAVSNVFTCGSSVAADICRAFGLNPDAERPLDDDADDEADE